MEGAEALENFKSEISQFFAKQECREVIGAFTEDGTLVGYVWLAKRGITDLWEFDPPMWIYDLMVAKDARGQGLGNTLLEKAEDFAKQRRFQSIGLHVFAKNEQAQRLYLRRGYERRDIHYKLSQSDFSSDHDHHDLVVRSMEDSELEKVKILGWESYSAKISEQVEDCSVARERYDTYVTNNWFAEKSTIYVILTPENELGGFVRVVDQESPNQSTKYCQIMEFGSSKGIIGIGKRALSFLEKQAKSKEQALIYAPTNKSEKELVQALVDRSYQEQSIFMFKSLD